MSEVYLHIGPIKTGSTYLQNAAWDSRHDLRERGLLLAAEHDHEFVQAANEVQDGRFVPIDPIGVWDNVVARAHAWPGPVLISHELFGFCEPDHIKRVVGSFAPGTLHLIFMARCQADMLPSVYQEKAKMASADESWEDFLAEHGDSGGSWFLGPGALLQGWLPHLDPQRVHVITVPKRMADPHLLLHRFSGVLGIDPAVLRASEAMVNTSLDAIDVALLRAVTAQTAARLDRSAQQELINGHLVSLLRKLDRPRRPLRLPASLRSAMTEAGARDVAAVTAAGCQIHGDLDELKPDDDAFLSGRETEGQVSETDILTAAIDALVAAVRDQPLDYGSA
jgi:hypothetical protein